MAREGFKMTAMIRAVTIITGPRIMGRMPLPRAFCKIVISLVRRVTREDVLK